MSHATRTRVLVTGLGAVSSYGLGVEALWTGVCSGRAAIGDFTRFDHAAQRTHVAGRLSTEPPLAELRPRERARLSRSDRMAVAATFEAVGGGALGARLAPDDRARAGVFLGSSTGGMLEAEEWFAELRTALLARAGGARTRDPRASRLAPHQTSAPAEAVARALGAVGPLETISSACAASNLALESALAALRSGEIEIAIAGGADGLCRLTYSGFNALRAVDELPARPFRADRRGLSLGEGAGLLVLETDESAARRGVRALAELAGAGSSCDAYHMTAPEPEGAGAALALQRALADARIRPMDVDFIDAHGTGTPHNDAAEWKALSKVFGERAARLPLTSTKGCVGHLLGACGGLEAVVTVVGLRRGIVHPTPGIGPVDPEAPVALVLGAPRRLPGARFALSLNLAFGGANAAIVLARADVPDGGAR